MASNINALLDTLKRQIVNTIIPSLSIEFPGISSNLSQYLNIGNNFASFTSLINSPNLVLYSSDVNALITLGYLDFYSLYVMLYTFNSQVTNLKKVTNGKLIYTASLFKELNHEINSKSILKHNRYTIYDDFISSKSLDVKNNRYFLQGSIANTSLDSNNILTLPISSSRKIKPNNIIANDIDNITHEVIINKDSNNIDYYINRLSNGKIGYCNRIQPSKINNTALFNPTINGFTDGYLTDNIFLKITSVDTDSNGVITYIWFIASGDGTNWSNAFSANAQTDSYINLYGEINTGLTIRIPITDNYCIPGDSWRIDLSYSQITNPKVNFKFKFNSLETVSYISYNDISSSNLDIKTSEIKQYKNQQFKLEIASNTDINNYFKTNGFSSLFLTASPLEEFSCTFESNKYNLTSVNGNSVHSYDFKLRNIIGHCNTYLDYGSSATTMLTIPKTKPIIEIDLYSAYKIDDTSYIKTNTALNLPLQYVEYNTYVTDNTSSIIIPVLNNFDTSNYITEYIVPYKIDVNISNSGIAYFSTRFPASGNFNLYSITSETVKQVTNFTKKVDSLTKRYNIEINNFDTRASYIIVYTPTINSFEDSKDFTLTSKWLTFGDGINSSIYYMYYRGNDSKIKTAIMHKTTNSTNAKLIPFSGNICGNIVLRSIDDANKTPFVFDYSLNCN